MLRDELNVGHSNALRSASRDSYHRQPDAYLRARTDEIIIFRPDEFGGMGALPSAAAHLLLFCFRFPSHEAAKSPSHGFDRVLFTFAQQLGVAPPAGFHFANEFAREFS